MANNLSNSTLVDEDFEYVDIHGRDIKVVIDENGKPLTPLLELKQMGFLIYEKSQYDKLLISEKQFTKDLYEHLLKSAEDYMIQNKINFNSDQVLSSIEKCKEFLTQTKKTTTSDFFKNRSLAKVSDDIKIQISNSGKSPSSLKDVAIPSNIHIPKLVRRSISPHFLESDQESVDSVKHKSNVSPSPKVKDKRSSVTPISIKHKQNCPSIPIRKLQLEQEYSVEVCCIDDNSEYFWVRLTTDLDISNDIYERICNTFKHQKEVERFELNKMYLAFDDDDHWLRCKIVKLEPLKVCFLDYGNVADVTTPLKHIPEELESIPVLAIKVKYQGEVNVDVDDEVIIKPVSYMEGGTYEVEIISNNEHEETESMEQVKWDDNKVAQKNFFDLPPSVCTIENGQRVTIIHEDSGILYLRNRQCFLVEADVNRQIENYFASNPSILESIETGQLVIHRKDKEYFRAQVVVINNSHTLATIKYLDKPTTETVKPNTIYNITEELSRLPITYFQSPILKDLEKGRALDYKSKEFIAICVQKRTKFTVIMDGDNFDLVNDSNNLLSELVATLKAKCENVVEGMPQQGSLKSQEEKSKSQQEEIKSQHATTEKVWLKNMEQYVAKLEVQPCVCCTVRDINNVTFVSMDALSTYINDIIKKELVDSTPYIPSIGEICFGYYVDVDAKDEGWYRCVALKEMDGKYEILFIDFGNTDLLKPEKLRQLTTDARNVPILAWRCRLIGLPQHLDIENIVKKFLAVGDTLKVNVRSFKNGKYNIEIPSIYKEISDYISDSL